MSNDSNWIPVTRKVILCETLQQNWSPAGPVVGAVGNITQPLASRFMSFPQMTSLCLCPCVATCMLYTQQWVREASLAPAHPLGWEKTGSLF